MSSEYLREFVNERLTAAAQEILGVFKTTISKYEEEIDRQRRLLDIVYKPVIKLHRIELPQQHVCKEEEVLSEQQLCIQERNQEDPEPPQIKEEEEELCSSQEGEQLVLKQETDASMLTPTHEERDHSEDQTLNVSPDDAQRAANMESAVNMPVISSVVSAAHSYHQLLSHSSLGYNGYLIKQTGENLYLCKTGGIQFYKMSVLKSHTRTVNPHSCDTCGKDFKYKTRLKAHMRSHADERPFSCDTCGKHFKYKHGFLIHMRNHAGEKLYVCKNCGKAFNNKFVLTRHMTTHTDEKPHSCETCGRAFRTKEALVFHTRRVHIGERPHCCSTCGKTFFDKSSLNSHVKSHTDERPFPCNTCGKGFRTNRDLKGHMKIHAGEKVKTLKNSQT